MNNEVERMIEALEVPGTRLRTALLLVPGSMLHKFEDIAALIKATPEDIVQKALDSVPEGSHYVNLSAERIEQWLDAISQRNTGSLRALVANLDLLLAGVDSKERQQVWLFVRDSMPYRRRLLLIAMPEDAKQLLPPSLEEWQTAGRCARWR
jgi:hypothetical protein